MKIVVAIASHKARELFLRNTLVSILGQNTKAETIYVYLNDYDFVPKWMDEMNSVVPVLGKHEAGDIGASAKFYFTELHNGAYVTIDDDLIYNPTFLGYITDMLYQYGNTAWVGFHGSRYLAWPTESYYKGQRELFYAYNSLENDEFVDVIGSGTMAHDTRFNCIRHTDLPERNMTDPQLCKIAKENCIPMVSLARPRGYIFEQTGSHEKAIWKSVMSDDTKQTDIINSCKSFELLKAERLLLSEFTYEGIRWGHLKFIASDLELSSKVLVVGSVAAAKYLDSLFEVKTLKYCEYQPDYILDRNMKNHFAQKFEAFVFVGAAIESIEGIKQQMSILNPEKVYFVPNTDDSNAVKEALKITQFFDLSMDTISCENRLMPKIYN